MAAASSGHCCHKASSVWVCDNDEDDAADDVYKCSDYVLVNVRNQNGIRSVTEEKVVVGAIRLLDQSLALFASQVGQVSHKKEIRRTVQRGLSGLNATHKE